MNMIIDIPFRNQFSAYIAAPEDGEKHPGLILIHEVWGLNEHIKDVANRLAEEGYNVLAPDLISQTGINEKIDKSIMKDIMNPEKRDEAQKKLRAAMAPIQSPEFAKITIDKMKACVDYLLANEKISDKVAVLGFCFGGTYSYALATSDKRIKAVVPFYGHAPEPLDKIKDISCPILAFYGEKDKALVDRLPELEKKMQEYHKNFEYHVYPNTGHAFFNNTNPTTYNKEAAEDSWKRTLDFLNKYLG
jgi:carboxymethylenebutenolidase